MKSASYPLSPESLQSNADNRSVSHGLRLPRWFFLRLFGGVYLIAFISFWSQAMGLIGAKGIAPAQHTLALMEAALTQDPTRSVLDWPSLFWLFGATDFAIHICCSLGVIFSLFLIFGWLPRIAITVLWSSYLSLFVVSSPFLGYQWDTLLLEVSVLAFFYAPHAIKPNLLREKEPSSLAVWMLRLLLFKLILSSGLVKLKSGDKSWQDLTALGYHFWTQPIPHQVSWYAHQMGDHLHQLGVFFNHFIELCIPWLIVFPINRLLILFWCLITGSMLFAGIGELTIGFALSMGGMTALMSIGSVYHATTSSSSAQWGDTSRGFATFFIVLLMVNVGLTGNYGFFNLLTIALVFPCLSHQQVHWLIPQGYRNKLPQQPSIKVSSLWQTLVILSAMILMPLNLSRLTQLLAHPQIKQARIQQAKFEQRSDVFNEPSPTLNNTQTFWLSIDQINQESIRAFGPLLLVNTYGLFARMTQKRYELIIEGSRDGKTWLPYRFKYKPNQEDDLNFAGLHMPRLDWQMWFAALYPRCRQRWFFGLMDALLEGAPSVLSLFEHVPFTDVPPRYVRVRRMNARFTTSLERSKTGQVWSLNATRDYCPTIDKTTLQRLNTGRF